jgi:hypothetical protein
MCYVKIEFPFHAFQERNLMRKLTTD